MCELNHAQFVKQYVRFLGGLGGFRRSILRCDRKGVLPIPLTNLSRTWGASSFWLLALAACLPFIGCGGGGDETGPSGPSSNRPPSASITAPSDGATFDADTTITFRGSAEDPEDGDLGVPDLQWRSSVDGSLGKGAQVTTSLSPDTTHRVLFIASDSEGAADTAAIDVIIRAPNQPPSATIASPSQDTTVDVGGEGGGDTVSFRGSAQDPEDGELTGDALTWSSDVDGELGTGDRTSSTLSPDTTHLITLSSTDSEGDTSRDSVHITVRSAASDVNYVDITVGSRHGCGRTEAGTAYCWGRNGGRLGDGTTTNRHEPVQVVGDYSFTTLSAGGGHTCGITEAGDAYCWGGNNWAQLGDGTETPSTEPVEVIVEKDFKAISAGRTHTCGVTTDGTAYCWGQATYGRLGGGMDENHPVKVSDGLDFHTITAGDAHSCGITTDDTAYCWGANNRGKLGDGTTQGSWEPVKVRGEHDFTTISAGRDHTCAVTKSGVGYCWGWDADGRLGDGPPSGLGHEHSEPIKVAGEHSFTEIRALVSHTCAVTPDQVGYCWGSGRDGRLGDGARGDQDSPKKIPGDYPFTAIDVGFAHTCAIAEYGNAYCWGDNEYGNLGIGSTRTRDQPVKVHEPKQ